MKALPPSPPLPPFPLPFASPPTDTAPEPALESAFPFPLLSVLDLLPPATPKESSPVVVVAFDVEVEDGDEAPPVAADVAVLVAAPPAPAVFVLEFEPAPPAPPVRLTDTVLIAELVCVSVLVSVLVLLPEFGADEEFDWLVAPLLTSSPNAVAANASASTATAASQDVCSLLT